MREGFQSCARRRNTGDKVVDLASRAYKARRKRSRTRCYSEKECDLREVEKERDKNAVKMFSSPRRIFVAGISKLNS